jgi:hypothetical protein
MMFAPEYDGDTPNRKWVRDKLAEKGVHLDAEAMDIRFWSIVGNLSSTEEAA